MTDILTPAKGLTKQTVGGNNNAWGTILNNTLALIDSALGGTLSKSITGNTALTSAEAQNSGFHFTGTLSATATITFPAFFGMAAIRNDTTNGHSIICGMSGGNTINVLYAETVAIWSDGTNFIRLSATGGGATVPNSGLTNSSMTIAGHTVSLGGSQSLAATDLTNGTTGSGSVVLTSSPTVNDLGVGGGNDGQSQLSVYGSSFTTALNVYNPDNHVSHYLYTNLGGTSSAGLYSYNYSGGQGPPHVLGYRGVSNSGNPGTEAGHFAFRLLDDASNEDTIAATYAYILDNTHTAMHSRVSLGWMNSVDATGGNAQPNQFINFDHTGVTLPGIPVGGVSTLAVNSTGSHFGSEGTEGGSTPLYMVGNFLGSIAAPGVNLLLGNYGAGGVSSGIQFRGTPTDFATAYSTGEIRSGRSGNVASGYATSYLTLGSASGNNTFNTELTLNNGKVGVATSPAINTTLDVGTEAAENASTITHVIGAHMQDSSADNLLLTNGGAGSLAASIQFRGTASDFNQLVSAGHIKSGRNGTLASGYATSYLTLGSASGNNAFNDELILTNGKIGVGTSPAINTTLDVGAEAAENASTITHVVGVHMQASNSDNLLLTNGGAGSLSASIQFRGTASDFSQLVSAGHIKSGRSGTLASGYATSYLTLGSASANNTYNDELTISNGTVTVAHGLTVGSTTLITTSVNLTNGAASQTATLANAPAAGNPTKWIPINDNGTTRYIPAW